MSMIQETIKSKLNEKESNKSGISSIEILFSLIAIMIFLLCIISLRHIWKVYQFHKDCNSLLPGENKIFWRKTAKIGFVQYLIDKTLLVFHKNNLQLGNGLTNFDLYFVMIDNKELENIVNELSLTKNKLDHMDDPNLKLKGLKNFTSYLLDFWRKNKISPKKEIESVILNDFIKNTNVFIDEYKDIADVSYNDIFSIEDSALIKGMITDTLKFCMYIVSKNPENLDNFEKVILELASMLFKISENAPSRDRQTTGLFI